MMRHNPPRPAILLDKDGTLLDDVPYNVDVELMRLAPTADKALARLAKLGVPLVVISNQSGVAEKRFEAWRLRLVGKRLAAMFAEQGATLAGFYWCPHARPPEGQCSCRKPIPGLLLQAAQELHLDLPRSWMIGDILDDIEAGRRAGCRTALIDNGNETEWVGGPLREPHLRATTLFAAVERISDAWRCTVEAA